MVIRRMLPRDCFRLPSSREKVEHDVFGAATTLQKLHNDYASATFPSQPLVESYLTSIENRADHFNKTGRFAFLYSTMDFLVKLFGGKTHPYSYFLGDPADFFRGPSCPDTALEAAVQVHEGDAEAPAVYQRGSGQV